MRSNIIALVGRPNVGKSTLFNRLSIKNKAIVHDKPGVTRDRKYASGMLGGEEFTLIDTPGLEEAEEGKIEERMMGQTLAAIKEADLVCLIVDARQGITPADKFFTNFIRKNNPNYIIIANKCEKEQHFGKEYFSLNGKAPIAISAEHNIGMMDLYEAIKDKLEVGTRALNYIVNSNEIYTKPDDLKPTSDGLFSSSQVRKLKSINHIYIAVVGRPNVGKSTFINSIVGSERLLTGPEAGITRESIEVQWEYKDYILKLVDTAGLRRKNLINEKLEKLSASDSIKTINYANIVVLMVDASLGLEHQDLTIANYAIDEGRGLVIAVNKSDLIMDLAKFETEFNNHLNIYLPHIKNIPIVFLSALKSKNLHAVFDECIKIYQIWNIKIPTNKLNKWLGEVIEAHPLPLKGGGRRVKIKYINQSKIRPPTFQLFTNEPSKIIDSYLRYLTNSIRDTFHLSGVPIRFILKKVKNPYID